MSEFPFLLIYLQMIRGHFPPDWIQRGGSNLLFIEGNIGASKTTFLQALNTKSSWKVNLEPTEMWREFPINTTTKGGQSIKDYFQQTPSGLSKNLLEGIYFGGVRNFTFQSMLINYYLDTISKELSQTQSNLAFERGLCSSHFFFTNIHRQLGTIDEIEGTVLDRQFQTASEFLNKAWKDRRVTFVYLKDTTKACLERVNLRGRSEEKQISHDFLQNLSEIHDTFFDAMQFQDSYGAIQMNLEHYTKDSHINHAMMVTDLLSVLDA
jgi:deoxyadenosine/deoxycytidine kinase